MKIRKIINSRIFYIPVFIIFVIITYPVFINKASDTFRGAFWGVIVGIIIYMISKYHELQAKRYNCLVYIEQELNFCFNNLHDNSFQVKPALETDKITLIAPMELNLTEEHIKHLGRSELRNELFNLFIDINKYNHAFKQAIEMFERNVAALKDFGIKKDVEGITIEDMIKIYYQQFKASLKTIYEFSFKLEDNIKNCLVKVRFFLKNDQPILSKKWLLPYYDQKEYKKWLEDDRKLLEREMAVSTQKDTEECKKAKELYNKAK